MMIDAHHHFWKFNPTEYGWMDESMSVLKRDYLPEDLEKELRASAVHGTVVVQARQHIEETQWLLELADRHPFILGVVGWLDLCSDQLERQLEEFAAHPKLVGVRHVIHDEQDDAFMLRPDFLRGIAQLEQYELVYDLLLFPRHLPHAIRLAETFPRQRFVLDHLGKPNIREGRMQPWKTDLAKLAGYPNVWCKFSGMVTEANWESWKLDDLKPYMDVVMNAFGPDWVMLGSDWPVCRLAAEYGRVMQLVPEFLNSLAKPNREKILYQNAIDCYQLKFDN